MVPSQPRKESPMLKVIDLDVQGKDGDGLVFTLTIGAEKFGVTDQEVVELIRAKHGAGVKAGKRPAPKKAAAPAEPAVDAGAEGAADGGEPEVGELSAH